MTQPKRVLYRGVPMVEGWSEKIKAAQELRSVKFKGREIPRIRYGKEKSDWAAANTPCHDCRVLEGEFHVPSCDVEECPVCGDQLITCDCVFDDLVQVPSNAVTVQVDFRSPVSRLTGSFGAAVILTAALLSSAKAFEPYRSGQPDTAE
jgi:hypothetical protein